MLIFNGVLLLSVGVLLFAGGLVASRNPRAPLWLKEGWGSTVLTFSCIGLLLWGLLALGQFAQSAADYRYTLEEAVLIVSDLIISLFIWTRLRVRKRLAAYKRAAQAVAATVELPSPERPITPKPSSPTKRAA